MSKTIQSMKQLENLSEKTTLIHKLHPLTKIIITIIYVLSIISLGKYDIFKLISLIIYPLITLLMGNIPCMLIIKRTFIALPFALFSSILNPILNREAMFFVGELKISFGMISFSVVLLKTLLVVSSVTILIATTGINKICYGMRKIKIPNIFVILIELIYRYITVLIEEVRTVNIAYRLRSGDRKGIRLTDGASVLGNILLRSISKAERIYAAMCLKGFKGEYHQNSNIFMRWIDFFYIIVWIMIFVTLLIIKY